jgi:hypothetical protein
MNICVLDGITLNPGDLSWDGLHPLGTCDIHERTQPGEIISRAANTAIILTNKTPLTGETLAVLPKLRNIGVLATGTNVVDLVAARRARWSDARHHRFWPHRRNGGGHRSSARHESDRSQPHAEAHVTLHEV